MKKSILPFVCSLIFIFNLNAQVTQINSNKSLQVSFPLNNSKTILVSDIDSSIWVTDATLPGTIQISPDIKLEEAGGLLAGKLIFRGSTPATGSEIYITDGTAAGTVLVKDIFPGNTSSDPGDFSSLGNFVYFSATTAAEGRELWKTDGTLAGTSLVKDIVPGPNSSNDLNDYNLFSNGSYLLFAAKTASAGIELWKSDGTNAGTVLLKDINTGADSSNPSEFYAYNNMVLFVATDATHGEEVWKTDGTPAGTTILKDINPGAGSSTTIDFGFAQGFHTFNNRVYFNADDGTSTGQVWVTDGTLANTTLLKDIVPGTTLSFIFLLDAVNLPNKFIFSVSADSTRSELWESDGTPGGTKLFKAFSPIDKSEVPFIFINYNFDFATGVFSQPLFQGSKFFFTAGNSTQGYELWESDGTSAGTNIVKDITPGTGNGIDISNSISYVYTTTALYFAANDGIHGDELWKTDGTSAGTSLVADIYTGTGNANPDLLPIIISNGKIIFTATNGDDPDNTDLYVIDGTFTPLPIKLSQFTVRLKSEDALLQWTTLNEINTKDFTIQRSYDGQHFDNIGSVPAANTLSAKNDYSFTDAGIGNSGRSMIYYRILTLDKDGKSESTNIIFIRLSGNTYWHITLLTNPVQNYANIMLDGITGNLQLSIKDLTGKTVYKNSKQNINGQMSIPVANLPRGMYVLTAETSDKTKSIKFIKQ